MLALPTKGEWTNQLREPSCGPEERTLKRLPLFREDAYLFRSELKAYMLKSLDT